jgi:ectoine hydroxylase-related dioxygenase (phytanoyl-CoA dioxygenase family)
MLQKLNEVCMEPRDDSEKSFLSAIKAKVGAVIEDRWGDEPEVHQRFRDEGFAIIPGVFTVQETERLASALESIEGSDSVRSRGGVFAVRNLLRWSPEVSELTQSARMLRLAEEFLGKPSFAVRATLFDKTGAANWLVPWHQDLTICVESREEVPDYGPWSVKGSAWHVQPPVRVLESMLAVRVHLDDCDESNGPLRVLPGTHTAGRLTAAEIAEYVGWIRPVVCSARRGDLLVMKPLLLHASSARKVEHSGVKHRRVIHIEYASAPLDGRLRWSSGICRGVSAS